MMAILVVALVLSLVSMAAGLVVWRAGGRGSGGPLLMPAATVASASSMLIESGGPRYALWGVAAILLVVYTLTMDRSNWRAARPLLWLGGATCLAIAASALLTVALGIQRALLALVVALSVSFLAAMVVMGLGVLRSGHPLRPR
jgi:hypothetical protein